MTKSSKKPAKLAKQEKKREPKAKPAKASKAKLSTATKSGTAGKTTTAGAAPKERLTAPSVVRPSFPIVVFDTETTGLTKNRTVRLDKQPEVIELYAVLVDLDRGPEPLKDYYTIIRPTVEYPMSAFTIRETKTKISNDELKDAPQFKDVADGIHDFLSEGNCPGNLAHNLSFDREMIEIELERLGRKIAWPKLGICTVEQTVHLRGRRLNQTALHNFLFQKEFEGAHRARNDVAALTNIAVELRKRGVI